MPFLTATHYIGAAVGFLIGVGGYIVIKFWIRPISFYRNSKQRLAAALETYPNVLREQGDRSAAESACKIFRQSAADLTNTFEHDLPSWYKIKLASRGEKPSEASGWLMKLANTKNADHAEKQIASIRKLLNF